ncbi:UPF0547 protein C16orf87 homolog isoform X3 [Chanos chanos]|uniref:UPF0547 protein C16orf87 homolog isoform X3 n=1 Tax=Chanos chanos TaxID=29144 RepID=A0A6J2UR94_CHACN|nr:UPF0547 protein C16orf87 homolog isoform X3 [Chanos chanos]
MLVWRVCVCMCVCECVCTLRNTISCTSSSVVQKVKRTEVLLRDCEASENSDFFKNMSANKVKKVKMATKSCPECDQQIPVACKSCPCGYVFISRKLLNAKLNERSAPAIEKQEKEVDIYANLSDEKAFVFSVALAEINRKILGQRLIL